MKNAQASNSNEASITLKAEGRSPYLLWLIWVVWLPLTLPAILQFLQSHPTLPHLIAILFGVALFFGIYLWAAWHRAQRLAATLSLPKHTDTSTWVTIAVLMALSFMLMLLGGNEWQTLLFYTSGFVGGSLPIRRSIVTVVAFTLLTMVVGWLSGLGWYGLVQAVVFIPAIVFITQVVIWSITTSWELQAARKEIARLAVMAERLRIARDLHDLLGHNLSLIALKSELARRLVAVSPERAITEISDVEQVARTTLQEVREAVASYRQPTLLNELHNAQEILAAAGITYQYDSDESSIGTLPTAVESVLAWAVREGVTNVIRHSRARHSKVRVGRDRHEAWLEVTDDGTGSINNADSSDNSGNGLRGLVERVEALGGRCTTGSRSEGGFRLAVSVPLVQENAAVEVPHVSTVPHIQQET